jgi:hypothetical protein
MMRSQRRNAFTRPAIAVTRDGHFSCSDGVGLNANGFELAYSLATILSARMIAVSLCTRKKA